MLFSDWSSDVCSSDLPVGLALLLSIESRDLGCDIRVKAVIGEPFAIAVDGNAMRRSGQPHAVGCLSVNDFRRNFVSNEDGALDRKSNTSELQSLMRISYAVFCLKKKKKNKNNIIYTPQINNQ